MSQPSVFIASAGGDLSDLRLWLSGLLKSRYGFIVEASEKGFHYDRNKPLDRSCYDLVEKCDILLLMIGKRYGSKSTSSPVKKKSSTKYVSITREEYRTARRAGLLVITLVDKDVFAQNELWQSSHSLESKAVEDENIHEFIDEVRKSEQNNEIYTYTDRDSIKRFIRNRFAALVKSYIDSTKSYRSPKAQVKINPLKLFYHRKMQNLSPKRLEQLSGVSAKRIRSVESRKRFKSMRINDIVFPEIKFEDLERLERALNCRHRLEVGVHDDDFNTMYLLFYHQHKADRSYKAKSATFQRTLFATKAIVFDFDGTLTFADSTSKSTWEILWTELGLDLSECRRLHQCFWQNEISHPEWCKLTADRFISKKLTLTKLHAISQKIQLLDDIEPTLKLLTSRGIRLYICSGSIKQIITKVLGSLSEHFDEISANNMYFDTRGYLHRIEGTKYDFSGKPDYINSIAEKLHISPLEILFVGNSLNDQWASKAGVPTLCVNPMFTNPLDKKTWTYALDSMTSLLQIDKFVTSSAN